MRLPLRARLAADLTRLAEFLNSNPRHPLTRALRAFKDSMATDAARDAAWPFLERSLSCLRVRFEPLRDGTRFTVGVIYPANEAGVVLKTIVGGMFTMLRYCRSPDCDARFFVAADHRMKYCASCGRGTVAFKEREKDRVRDWRRSLD